jgi:hypothetical protein
VREGCKFDNGANNCIQTNLIGTFSETTFTANNALATPFNMATVPATCGCTGTGACNFYDAFGPPAGTQIATIEFVGKGGAINTFALVGGQDIRDFNHGTFANTLTNGISGVQAVNAFSCEDPQTCLGAGGTGDVNTGDTGNYRIDEQVFTLSGELAT